MRLTRPPRLPEFAASGRELLAAQGISVVLGGNRILDSVDLTVRAGELVALAGPNGAGKSTLLNVLTGDLAPATGSVTIDGEPLADWSDRDLAMRRAVLPQMVTVTFPFLVDDIVRMGRSPWLGTEREDEDDAAVANAMALTEVEHLAGRQFPSLSGGEHARVALARVLAQSTQLLLLDEPTASLDLRHQELVLEVVRARASAGYGAVVVLHDLGLAGAHADRIALLSNGRLVAEGPPEEVLQPELLTRVYRHPIEVIPHPLTGGPIVLPVRH